MKFLLPFLLILPATIATAQQHHTFEYARLNDSTRQFKSGTRQIIFGNYKKSDDNLKERSASVNGEVFLVTVNESKAGLLQVIRDSAGATIATVFLDGPKTNDIVSGSMYFQWKSIDNDHWVYLLKDEEVIRCAYQKTDSLQQVDITHYSPLPPGMLMAILEKSLVNVRHYDFSGREGRVQVGIKGGMNLSILSASINSESQFNIGLNAGVYFKVPIGRNTFFRPEIFYSIQGQKDKYTNGIGADAGETTTTLEYINVPLLLEFGKTVTLQIGVQAGFLRSAREEGRITTQTVDDDLLEFTNTVDMSFVAGIGANFTPRFNMGARYNLGMTDIFKEEYKSYQGFEFPAIKNRVFHFYLGYSF